MCQFEARTTYSIDFVINKLYYKNNKYVAHLFHAQLQISDWLSEII